MVDFQYNNIFVSSGLNENGFQGFTHLNDTIQQGVALLERIMRCGFVGGSMLPGIGFEVLKSPFQTRESLSSCCLQIWM